jgi:hypothetical protein
VAIHGDQSWIGLSSSPQGKLEKLLCSRQITVGRQHEIGSEREFVKTAELTGILRIGVLG